MVRLAVTCFCFCLAVCYVESKDMKCLWKVLEDAMKKASKHPRDTTTMKPPMRKCEEDLCKDHHCEGGSYCVIKQDHYECHPECIPDEPCEKDMCGETSCGAGLFCVTRKRYRCSPRCVSDDPCPLCNVHPCANNPCGKDTCHVKHCTCEHECSSPCSGRPDPGVCYAYFPSWYYNERSGTCESFIYGGCGGNENRHETKEDCMDTCGRTCVGGPETGNCRAAIPSWYYDTSSGTCKKFIYGGCGGNGNRYETEEDCMKKCFTSICHLPTVVGPCEAAMPRYYFNKNTGNCELFTYGGCEGNKNNFKTPGECKRSCVDDAECPLFPAPPPQQELLSDVPCPTHPCALDECNSDSDCDEGLKCCYSGGIQGLPFKCMQPQVFR